MPCPPPSSARRALAVLVLLPIMAPAWSQATTEGSPPFPPAASPAQASYLLGLTLGNQLEHNGLAGKVVLGELIRGLKEGLADAPVSAEQRAQVTQFMRGARDTLTDQNRSAATEFLARNKTASGVTTTASGLEYRVVSDGDSRAPTPKLSDQVTVRYRGRLLDGTLFDSSDAHAEAATFRMTSIIKGWQEALLMMHPGASWQLWVPPELAYDTHAPPGIPPGALIVYDLELVKVEAPVLDPRLLRKKPAVAAPAASDAAAPR